eukprot:TRINITY_DN7669_c0_g2_i8.p1 TRINITY_DN7669_c0_g2~~TRINITY_DN7669_c0_g2_i8.p1  ORF type:complete len:259 (-),score=36.45 TRINITY_DN7669_c0_g2_i8:218-994(-)
MKMYYPPYDSATHHHGVPYPYPPPPNYIPNYPTEGVRTVFISNLPHDVKHREIHNMFRLAVPGYERCKIAKEKPDSPPTQSKIAFASFVDRAAAMVAIQRLNGFPFDAERDCLIHLELAKTDDRSLTKLREPREEFRRPNELYLPPAYPVGSIVPETRERKLRGTKDDYESSSLPPCATLYVSGFDSSIQIENLKALFQELPGYVRLALGKDGTHAFVNFVDSQSSTAALNQVNGTKVGSSTLNVYYARRNLQQTFGF